MALLLALCLALLLAVLTRLHSIRGRSKKHAPSPTVKADIESMREMETRMARFNSGRVGLQPTAAPFPISTISVPTRESRSLSGEITDAGASGVASREVVK